MRVTGRSLRENESGRGCASFPRASFTNIHNGVCHRTASLRRDRLRFLLINPPSHKLRNDENKAVLPLGLAYLAASLIEGNVTVSMLDAVIEGIFDSFDFRGHAYYGLSPERIRCEIEKNAPDVVGVSCMFTHSSRIVLEICRIAKECGVPYTLVGGPTPTALPQVFVADPNVDLVFLGESERSLVEFAERLKGGGEPDWSGVEGILYKNGHGAVVQNPRRSFIERLDDIPFPARHLLPMEKYFRVSSPQGGVYKSRRTTPIVTSRGCTGRCCFCASSNVWGRKYRTSSAENVLRELAQLKAEYRIREFQVQDDNFTFKKKRALEICRGVKDLGLYWSMPNGAALWSLDEERVRAMGESGCHYVIAAFESGNPRVLKEVVRKPLNLEKAVSICNAIRRHGIHLSGFFVVGFPDESLEEIRDTFRFAARCGLHMANFSYATPLPSTALWEQAERENLFVDGFSLEEISYERPSLRSKNWTTDELQSLVLSLSRRFYLRTLLRRPMVILFRLFDSLKRNPLGLLRIVYTRTLGAQRLQSVPVLAVPPGADKPGG